MEIEILPVGSDLDAAKFKAMLSMVRILGRLQLRVLRRPAARSGKSRSNNPSLKRPISLAAPEQNCGS